MYFQNYVSRYCLCYSIWLLLSIQYVYVIYLVGSRHIHNLKKQQGHYNNFHKTQMFFPFTIWNILCCISLLVKPLFYIKFLNQAFQLINFLTVNEKKIQKIVSITFTYLFLEDTTIIINNT